MDFLYLNGTILPATQAAISPFDRGFLYGDGLFETLRIYNGRGHLLRRHLRRLIDGLDYLGIPHPDEEELADAVHRTIAANAAVDAILRLTVTRGVGGSVAELDEPSHPTILITLKPLLQNDGDRNSGIKDTGKKETDGKGDEELSYPDATSAGERLITLDVNHVEPAIGRRLKMLNYLPAIHSVRALAAAGVREGILLTRDGIIAEGTVSNLFCVVDNVLFTPPLDLGILPGITRERVIELAREDGIEVREEKFDRDFFVRANECFYTNSVREIVAVVNIDEHHIGTGQPGPVAISLLSRYNREAC